MCRLRLPQHQMAAIVGPSGSGKSTFLGLIAGLDRPTSGSIRLDGKEITHLRESEMARYRRQKIGYIFQSFHLIPTLTAWENVAIPLELTGERHAKTACDRLADVRRAERPAIPLSGATFRRRTTASCGRPSIRLSSTDLTRRRAYRQS